MKVTQAERTELTLDETDLSQFCKQPEIIDAVYTAQCDVMVRGLACYLFTGCRHHQQSDVVRQFE